MNRTLIEMEGVVWWRCKQDYERIMCLLSDTMFLANEKDLHSIFTLLREVRERLDWIGKFTGMNGQERIEVKS